MNHEPEPLTIYIIYKNNFHANSSSWWFQPIWNILVKLDDFPR